MGGNEFGRVEMEFEETSRVRTFGSEDARSDARAVRELNERSLWRRKDKNNVSLDQIKHTDNGR